VPQVPPQVVRAQIKKGTLDPVYLIIGDDDAEMSELVSGLSSVVEEGLQPFNLERLYAGEKSASPQGIVQAARTIPMLGDRRVVIVLRAERLLKPKRRSDEEQDSADGKVKGDPLADYVAKAETGTTLVFVASEADRTRKLYKALQKSATIVECYGLRGSRDAKVDLRQAARMAEQLVRQAVKDAGQQIDPQAARLIAERAGADITTLRGDLERLLLYAAGKPKIDLDDVRAVVTAETAQDDWAVTNAIQRGDAAEALRQVGLAMESGGVPYQILGQLGWFVHNRLPEADARRVPAAVEALFRTDFELKRSGGDPRVLLERLVVELCRR
jgi:DNA polymerase-3 subunit delta